MPHCSEPAPTRCRPRHDPRRNECPCGKQVAEEDGPEKDPATSADVRPVVGAGVSELTWGTPERRGVPNGQGHRPDPPEPGESNLASLRGVSE